MEYYETYLLSHATELEILFCPKSKHFIIEILSHDITLQPLKFLYLNFWQACELFTFAKGFTFLYSYNCSKNMWNSILECIQQLYIVLFILFCIYIKKKSVALLFVSLIQHKLFCWAWLYQTLFNQSVLFCLILWKSSCVNNLLKSLLSQ